MKTQLILMFATGLLVGSVAAQEGGDRDKKNIQGTWKVLSVETDGEKVPKEKFEKARFVITADTLTMAFGDGKEESRKYKIDPSTKPKALDLIALKKGGEPGQYIYDLDGDSLKICWAERGAGRPKAFESKSGITLVILKREK